MLMIVVWSAHEKRGHNFGVSIARPERTSLSGKIDVTASQHAYLRGEYVLTRIAKNAALIHVKQLKETIMVLHKPPMRETPFGRWPLVLARTYHKFEEFAALARDVPTGLVNVSLGVSIPIIKENLLGGLT